MTRSHTSTEPEAEGNTEGNSRALVRYLPGAIGAACIVAGLAVIWWPLGLIAFGVFCLLMDRRL